MTFSYLMHRSLRQGILISRCCPAALSASCETNSHCITELRVCNPHTRWRAWMEIMIPQELHAQAYLHHTRISTALGARQNIGAHTHCNKVKNNGHPWEGQAPSPGKGWWSEHTFIRYKSKRAEMSRNGDGASGRDDSPSVPSSAPRQGLKARALFPYWQIRDKSSHPAMRRNWKKAPLGTPKPDHGLIKDNSIPPATNSIREEASMQGSTAKHAFITDNATSREMYRAQE